MGCTIDHCDGCHRWVCECGKHIHDPNEYDKIPRITGEPTGSEVRCLRNVDNPVGLTICENCFKKIARWIKDEIKG